MDTFTKKSGRVIIGAFLFLMLLISAADANAQRRKKAPELKPVLEPEYLTIIGATRSQFAEWAKQKNKWDPSRIEYNFTKPKDENIFSDTSKYWWDEYYVMDGEKQIFDRSPWTVRYRYIFKSDRLIVIQIEPINSDQIENEVKKYYEFFGQKEISQNIALNVYASNDHKFLIQYQTVITDTGFEKKQHFEKLAVRLAEK